MTEKNRLVIITGSVREGRFGPTVGGWIERLARQHPEFEVDVVDLAELDVPLTLPAVPPKFAGADYPRPERLQPIARLLDEADAFIVVTPEYNNSYPASLKAFIDWHFTQWTAKPVSIVTYGGVAGGRHAALHLQNVFVELYAVPLRDGLTFPNYFVNWDGGQPLDPESERRAGEMLDQLAWWGGALREARDRTAYPAAA